MSPHETVESLVQRTFAHLPPEVRFKPLQHIADAFLILALFRRGWQQHPPARVTLELPACLDDYCVCTIEGPDLYGKGLGTTMSEAICLAALRAAKIEVPA